LLWLIFYAESTEATVVILTQTPKHFPPARPLRRPWRAKWCKRGLNQNVRSVSR